MQTAQGEYVVIAHYTNYTEVLAVMYWECSFWLFKFDTLTLNVIIMVLISEFYKVTMSVALTV
jgi:hypothetical protein